MGGIGLSRARIARLSAAAAAAAGVVALFAAPALAAAPTVSTGAASSITFDSAVLAGNVNPGGASSVVYFQYGTTNKYGAQSAPYAMPAGTKSAPIAIAIGGLTAGTVYHYRIVATNATGTALGADRSLTTAKIPLALAITAAPNPVAYGGAVTVEGTLSGTGSANAPVVLQASAFPYTAGFVNVGNPELTLSTGAFAFNVLGLATNTQYRVVSGNVASAAVVVSVAIGVTLHAHAAGTHRHPTIRFGGTIAPAEPSARIAFERLIGSNWKVVGGTVAAAVAVNDVVAFNKTVSVHAGGFFRALVLPVEGAHVSGYSTTVQVRIK